MSVHDCESENSEIIFARRQYRVPNYYSSEKEEERVEEWSDPSGNQPIIRPFASPSGFVMDDISLTSDAEVEHCYELFVPDTLVEDIVVQTNLYASQQVEGGPSKRLQKWTPTNKCEMKRFLGLILWMGLVKLPAIHLYWSQDPAYMQTFPKSVMSRNRFELLLRMLYFADNTNDNESNPLSQIQPLLHALETNFKKHYNPSEDICIDESLIPFRGRITFRHYLKQKRLKYGVKIYKLCCDSGYTYAFRVDAGKSIEEENTPTKIAMCLCKDLFHKGHTLYTDNWCTSLELAENLIDKNVHLVGTLRANQRGNPPEVISKKLKQGEVIAKQNQKGITILKWKDKREILVLSTKHSSEMVSVQSRSGNKLVPKIIVDYNRGRAAVHLNDRMNGYDSSLRRSLKWYKKLAIELLLNTAVLNSFILFKNTTTKRISITEFRKKLAVYLTNFKEAEVSPSSSATSKKLHHLQTKPGRVSAVRKYCKSCYEKNVAQSGRKLARNLTKQSPVTDVALNL